MDNESEIEKLARMIKSEFDSVRGEMRDGFAAVNERLDKTDKRLDGADKRVDGFAYRLAQLDQKLDQHRQETKDGFAGIYRFIAGISTTLADHEERIKELKGE